MNLELDLKTLECALVDVNHDQHFLVKPVTLLCGHACCYKCIESFNLLYKINKIKCVKCEKENTIDLDLIAESTIVSNYISSNLNNIFGEIRKRFQLLFNQFKTNLTQASDHFDAILAFTKEEVDIRVESLKLEIDSLSETIKKSMENLREEFKSSIQQKYEVKFNDCFNHLDQSKINPNDKILDNLQQNLKELNEAVKYLKVFNPQPIFSSNKEKLSMSIIGTVDCNFNNLVKTINPKKYQIVDLDYELRGLCYLEKTNQILAANTKNRCLTIFNDQLNIIQEINDFDGETILPRYIATNGVNKIFIVQSGLHKITCIDLEFNFVKEYGDMKGSRSNQFDCPLGICYHDQSIYICDSMNKRIQKLSENLIFESSFPLEFKPWEIKISNNYACIRPNEYENIFFFSLNPFKFIKFTSYGNGVILNSKFWFYVLNLNKTLSCYDLCGNLVDRIRIDALENIDINDGQVALECLDNRNLVLSCKSAKKLVLIQ